MFDDGRDRRGWRPVDPPLEVEVRMLRAFSRQRGGGAGRVPLWVDAAGLNLRGIEPALMDGWLLTSVGTWWARVHLRLRSRNGDLDMPQTLFVPAESVRPATAGLSERHPGG